MVKFAVAVLVMLVMVVLTVFVEPLLLWTVVVRRTIIKVAAESQVWQQRFLLCYYYPFGRNIVALNVDIMLSYCHLLPWWHGDYRQGFHTQVSKIIKV